MLFLIASVFANSIVEIVNTDPTSTWVAVEYHPSVITHRKFIAMLGEQPFPIQKVDAVEPSNVPEEYDARKDKPGSVYAVRDQGSCGSCWAFGASGAMAGRLTYKGCPKGQMSAQDLTSCDTTNYGCNGGSGPTVTAWIARNGITTDACIPYVSGSGRVPACPRTCTNGSEIIRYKYSQAITYTMANIQDSLMADGPVYFRFNVYDDFMSYRSGIYQHKSGGLRGGHAVLLIGWGIEGGVKFWILQNSWGGAWGEQGYFRMIRGINDCGCEQGFYSGPVVC